MTDLMAEVNEAMRQERLEKFWKENGKTLIFFVVATIIMTGVISAYRSWDASVRIAGTDKVLALMDDKTFPDNLKDAKLDMRPGLRGVVLLNGAAAYVSQKKNKEALALYTKAAEDKSIPADVRDLAILQQARLTVDAAHNPAITKNLDDVINNRKSPWRYHARIEAAVLASAKNDYKTAREQLAALMDDKALPETLYNKARALDHVYALKAPETTTPPKADDKAGS